jgi:hypothetical protein
MLDDQTLLMAAAIFAAFLVGRTGPRWRFADSFRKRSGKPWRRRTPKAQVVSFRSTDGPVTDAADQLRIVMQASFEPRKLMSKNEARIFYQVEKAVQAAGLGWRVMAQVSLGEVLKSSDHRAHSTINSKRVDILLISGGGDPIAAIEYQGSGHYLGSAAARDAVKREALRRAGVEFVEIKPDHSAEDVAREVQRLARAAAPVAA